MLIGIDASRASLDKKTGVEWYAYNIIKSLKALDKTNDYLLYSRESLPEELVGENFKSKILPWPLKKFWTLGALSFEMYKHQSDVLFVPAHNLPLFHGKFNVVTWHDLAYRKFPRYYSFKQYLSLLYGDQAFLKYAQNIITVSEFSKQELIAFGVKAEKITVAPLAYNSAVYHSLYLDAEIKETQAKYKISQNYFIYVGRLETKKNVANLIKAYNLFRAQSQEFMELVLVGGSGFGYQAIKQEILNSPYKNDIKELGYLPSIEIAKLLNGATALTFLSNYEGFGMPVLEALACDCPVIINDQAALKEVAGNAALVVKASLPEEVAKAMDLVVHNSQIRSNLCNLGRLRVAGYSWTKCAVKTLEVLTK